MHRLGTPLDESLYGRGLFAGGSAGGLYRIVHTGTWSGVYSFPAQGVPQMCR